MKRKMALDYGVARIGIAFSDLLCMIANGYETYCRKDIDKDLDYLSTLASKQEVDEIVMGLPLNMDGTEGDRAVATKLFGEKLSKYSNLPVTYVDERLSSVEAEDILKQAHIKWQDRKKYIDKISATIILQTYLDSRS